LTVSEEHGKIQLGRQQEPFIVICNLAEMAPWTGFLTPNRVFLQDDEAYKKSLHRRIFEHRPFIFQREKEICQLKLRGTKSLGRGTRTVV
jgi:hypothetical protein